MADDNGRLEMLNILSNLIQNAGTSIEEQVQKEKLSAEQKNNMERAERLKKAAALVEKFPDMKELFAVCYGEKTVAYTYEHGSIDFNPDSVYGIVGGEKFSYDDYIEIQLKTAGNYRTGFAACYYNCVLGFKGTISKKRKNNICFERIYIEGMYSDGTCYDDKEDHVWMDSADFEEYEVGDCLSFYADVYRYIKTGSGKALDFGIRHPQGIKKIESYKIPTDRELMDQEITGIICENCYLSESCNKSLCVRHDSVKKEKSRVLDFMMSHRNPEA